MSLGLTTGNAKAALAERGDDLYETPACAVDALLEAEHLPEQHRTDPASAAFHYLNELLAEGHRPQDIYKIYKCCPDRKEALALEHKLITTTPHLVNRDRRRYEAAA